MTTETQRYLLLQKAFRFASNMANEAINNYGAMVAPSGRPREEMKKLQRAFSDFDSELRKTMRMK